MSRGYIAECIILYILLAVYGVVIIRYVSPVFFVFLLFSSATVTFLVHTRRIATPACTFFTVCALIGGISNMRNICDNQYVFIPGILLLFFNTMLIMIFRPKEGKKKAVIGIALAAAVAVTVFEALRYHVPEGIVYYFRDNPVNFTNIFRWLTISNQSSLGFLVPGAAVAFLLFATCGKERAEKSLFLTGAAILAFFGGFLGFFGYKDMASPVLLLSVLIWFCIDELHENKKRIPALVPEIFFTALCFYELAREAFFE